MNSLDVPGRRGSRTLLLRARSDASNQQGYFGRTIEPGEHSGNYGARLGYLKEKGIGEDFQYEAREHLQPGTSALFLVIEQAERGGA